MLIKYVWDTFFNISVILYKGLKVVKNLRNISKFQFFLHPNFYLYIYIKKENYKQYYEKE